MAESSRIENSTTFFHFSGAKECSEELIDAGADVNAKGSNESTPLILAANGGHIGVVKVLLKHPKIRIHEQVCVQEVISNLWTCFV